MRGLRWVITVVLVVAAAPVWALPEGRPGATADERQLGALAAEQIIRQHGLVRDEAMQARVEAVGRTLTKHVAGGGEGYRFKVLRSDDVNALTTPDGHVFVTRALLRTFKSDDELAAVLAHEIAHVLLGHTAKLLTETDEVRTVTVRTRSGRLRQRRITVTSDNKKRWEFEADETGLELLLIAGYPIDAMERVLIYLTQEESERGDREAPSRIEELTSTHPRSVSRLTALRRILAERYRTPRDPGPPTARISN